MDPGASPSWYSRLPVPQAPRNPDLWEGTLMFVTPDGKEGPQGLSVSVSVNYKGPRTLDP